MKKVRVGILCNIVVPYTLPVFERLSRAKELDVEVLYMAEGADNRRWNTESMKKKMQFKHRFLPGKKITFTLKNEPVQYVLNPSIFSLLWKRHFDVIIVYGWLDFACQMVALFRRITGQRYIVWSDSTAAEKSWIRTVTRPFVSWFLRGASAYVVSGRRAASYLSDFGIDASDIFRVPNTIDTAQFSSSVMRERKQKEMLKKKFKLPREATIVLFVGQFIPRKGVDLLLESASRLKAKNIHFLLVGYGEEEKNYKSFCRKHTLKNTTILSGVNPNRVIQAFAIADVFVLPSREETWGMVVNEALASKLPVIVSDKVGCGEDLVQGKGTGSTFQSGDVESLTAALEALYENPKKRKQMAERSYQLSLQYSPDTSARGYKKAISHAIYS